MDFKLKRLDIDIYSIDDDISYLYDEDKILSLIAGDICNIVGTELIKCVYNKFEPQGSTLLCVLGDSSMAIHSYPEKHFYTFEIHTCGIKAEPLKVLEYLKDRFNTKDITYNYTESRVL